MTRRTSQRTIANRVLSTLLSALLAVTLMPAAAFATSNEANAEVAPIGQNQETSNTLTPSQDEASASEANSSSDANNAATATPATPEAPVTPSDPAPTYSPMAGSMSVRLDSDAPTLSNGSIKCGVPVKFTLNASGGSGSYKYLFGSLALVVDGEQQSVHDGTWHLELTTINTLEYTFKVSGTYWIYWTAYDANNLENTAHVYQPIVVNDPSYPSIEQYAQSVVDQCNSKGFATQYDKALFYNNYIIDNTEYDYTLKEAGAIGVFVKNPDGSNGSATCEGYFQALKMLLDRSHIRCVRTTGGAHTWATVCLDGVWTQVDPTWSDDKYAPFKNMYFGLTDEMSELVHDGYTRDPQYACTSYQANYLYRSGEVGAVVADMKSQIEAKLASGQRSFRLGMKGYYPYDEPYYTLYPMVASELGKMAWGEYALGILCVNDTSKVPDSLPNGYIQVDVACPHENLEDGLCFDENSHWGTCSDCGASVGATSHVFSEWAHEGSNLFHDVEQSRTCSVCGYDARSLLKAKLPGYAAYSAVYDPEYYAQNNPDVRSAFHGDEVQIFYHYLNCGMAEGRRASGSFDVASYYNANPDLRRAFGADLRALATHYVTNGRFEGRACRDVPDLRGFASRHAGTDYSPVYDGAYYRDAYGDLRASFSVRKPAGAVLFDDAALLAHFVSCGMAEGRRASGSFDVASYYNANPDLRRVFGTDLRALATHYVTNGRLEGRACRDVPDLRGFASRHAGTDYSPVYDGAYYRDAYGDLRASFSVRKPAGAVLFDDAALLAHFVSSGMAEGRRASDSFDVRVYRSAYSDLRAAFGEDTRAYYVHYLNYGLKEGRAARLDDPGRFAAESEELAKASSSTFESEADSGTTPVDGDTPFSPFDEGSEIKMTREEALARFVQPEPEGGAYSPQYISAGSYNAIMRYALNFHGWRYVWGGKSPSTGFDCSGLVSHVYGRVLGANIYTNAAGIANGCYYVSPSDARPGDLVFWRGTYGNDINYVSHVGIYCGDDIVYAAGDPIGFYSIHATRNIHGQPAAYFFGRVRSVDEGQVATAAPVSASYDLVFDNDFYCFFNPSAERYAGDASYGLSHFMNSGMGGGLRANMVFDLDYYKIHNPDLRAAFGDANSKYYEHYAVCGTVEGRRGSAEFDLNYYKSLYPDLRAAFGRDNRAYVYHFLRCGMREGRVGCEEFADFNVANYRNHYPDLQAAFEDRISAYYAHYVKYGKAEGRTGADASIVGTTMLGKVDYAPVYDYSYYVGNNPDVLRAFGGDPVDTIRHFLNHGMAEGRRGCQGFDVASYYNANKDLREAFGTDLRALAMHYVTNGSDEGRVCEGVPSLSSYLNYLQGVNYSPVYDGAHYYARYPDLRSAFMVRTPAAGNLYDDRALLRHFVSCGMSEGRQASSSFNVHSYRGRYPDLRAAYGSNLKGYYEHYLVCGIREGRSAT